MKNHIILAEPIHKVIQGEGPNLGKKMLLFRFMGCDVQCPGCDSFHTWDSDRLSKTILRYDLKDLKETIIGLAKEYDIYHILFTGGEPHLWMEEIQSIVDSLVNLEFKFDIETTGLKQWPIGLLYNRKVYFNFSPKVGALKPGPKYTYSISQFHPYVQLHALKTQQKNINFCIKIVCSKENWDSDLIMINSILSELNLTPDKIYIMPLGETFEEISKQQEFLIEKCFEYKFNYSPRMHILIYDNRRLV